MKLNTTPHLRRYADEGLTRTSNILQPGQTSGIRLFNVQDTDRMIDASIQQHAGDTHTQVTTADSRRHLQQPTPTNTMISKFNNNQPLDMIPTIRQDTQVTTISDTSATIHHLRGIVAVFGDQTGDIRATYDLAGEQLLRFGTQADGILMPILIGPFREPATARDMREFPMTFVPGRSVDPSHAVSEKLAAWSVMRDLMGLPTANLRIVNGYGHVSSYGRFINPERALLVAVSGAAWAARNGIWPGFKDLEIAEDIIHDYPYLKRLSGEQVLSVENLLKWKMSEAVKLLNRHAAFIRELGRKICREKYMHNCYVWVLLRGEMRAAHMKWPDEYPLEARAPYSLSGA